MYFSGIAKLGLEATLLQRAEYLSNALRARTVASGSRQTLKAKLVYDQGKEGRNQDRPRRAANSGIPSLGLPGPYYNYTTLSTIMGVGGARNTDKAEVEEPKD